MLQASLEGFLGERLEDDFAGVQHRVVDQSERGHDRQDYRRTVALSLQDCRSIDCTEWADLRTPVVVDAARTVAGEESCSRRIYISDLPYDDERLMRAPREHWSIENSQHWVLDVQFGEDYQHQLNRKAAANLAALRRICLGLLRNEKSNALSIKNKRMICGIDERYLVKVFKSAVFDA